MKAAVNYEAGGPDVLRYEDVPDPEPGDGDVLVRVEAVSIEGGDTLNRLGGPLVTVPHVVGYQCAGTVLAVGDEVSGIKVGDRVVSLGLFGSHAELRVSDQSFCWLIPDGLSTVEAACVPTAYGTAHDSLFEFGRLQAGETVLIHAGASGVGIAAIQLAKQGGATVLATASSDDRLGRLKEYGLDHGINYAETDFSEAVRSLTGGKGADLIVDGVGGETTQKSLGCLAYRGRIVTFGNAGRDMTSTLDIAPMRGNNQTLVGYFLGAELFLTPRPRPMIANLLEQVAKGELKVVVDREFSLADAAAAHAYIESRQAFGRVVLVPQTPTGQ
jgi:NADPH2:quinone reductase